MIQFYVKKGDVIDFNVIHSDSFFQLVREAEEVAIYMKHLIRQYFVQNQLQIYIEKIS